MCLDFEKPTPSVATPNLADNMDLKVELCSLV
jgi:hypothetical protein